jgi:iron(III) transport system permease protein
VAGASAFWRDRSASSATVSSAVVTFGALVLLITDALALKGYFKGDRFVSASVGVIVASIVIFTAWPVMNILSYIFSPRGNLTGMEAFADRAFDRKIWGLACVTSRVSCGVFWNTLVLAISTATAATILGLAFALIVTRTGFPLKKGMRLLTVLPIITPPFVIGLGLILIFGRSGVVNQLAESWFGLQLGRWIYGMNGVWLAQVFSFTPTAFLVLIGVVEGISPTMEEASQTLRADKMRTFKAVTLPLMMPGLANAWLSYSSRALRISETPSCSAAPSACCRPRSSFRSWARSRISAGRGS